MSERVVTVGGNRATRPITEFERKVVGTEFYVSSVNGDDGRSGRSVATSVATIDHALSLMTADQDDVLYLLPGHAETVSEAAGMVFDVAGITVVGVGAGSLQPTITIDTVDTADIDIDAANVVIENVHFRANIADVVAAIDVNADDFTLRNCRFTEVATSMNALIWIQDALAVASDRITVEGCYAKVVDAANTHFINFAGTGDGHVIKGNTLMGDWGTMAIGGAGIVTNIVIVDNIISNAASDNDSCINLAATTTGIVMRNLACGATAQANGITATACAIAENYYGVVSEDLSAIIEPAVT